MTTPLGRLSEDLSGTWPEVPVLLLGPPDSGRRTWAEWLLRQHRVRAPLIFRAADGLSAARARALRTFLGVRSREPKWALVGLDQTEATVQNSLLKIAEELPPTARVIFTGSPRRVLPTIASRSRVVRLRPASRAEEIAWVEASAGVSRQEATEAVTLARGRPAAALRWVSQADSAARAYHLAHLALSGDRVAVASGLNDSETDWEQVRQWLAGWAARCEPPRLSALQAAREIHRPRLAVRTALDRLVRSA